MSPAAEKGLLADGSPLADETQEFDSIVHPTRGRIELTIATTGPLLPDADIELAIGGVAREPIDGGEVVLTLPTKALMDHDETAALPELPVVARWELPSMAAGETWSASHTIPGEAEGYYRVLANAYTHGPDGGIWLADEVFREAWMFVDETGGQLASLSEDAVFPEAATPPPGPAAGWPVALARVGGVSWHRDTVYLQVVYTIGNGWKVAEEALVRIRRILSNGRQILSEHGLVPEDGIVAVPCRGMPDGQMWGDVKAPDTHLVQGRDDIARWLTNETHCGRIKPVEVLAHRYYPWRLLNIAADTLIKHFGHSRGRIKWKLSDEGGGYNGILDKITLPWNYAGGGYFRWVAAHEYGHALHHKALGGIWSPSPNCSPHYLDSISSYRCALKEGFADYAGTVGSGYYENCFEHFGTTQAYRYSCRNFSHDRKPEIEGWVAAFFMDLIDDEEEEGDYTEYSGLYVAQVFKTCEKKHGRLPWYKRKRVSDIVWCMENAVTPSVHEEVFPRVSMPSAVRRDADEPDNWRFSDFRLTWRKNLSKSLH